MGSVRTRMVRATTTTVLLLLLQAAAYHQASVPTHANTVLTDAAVSLEESLALDYDVLPMFKDITFMMESLVELMPYLEEAERPVITKAYEYLLNLESSLSLDFRTTLGLLKDKATKYGGGMQSKIQRYPKKLKSSLRTLKSFFAQVSTNMDNLVEASETALTHAKVVLVSVEAFRNMMKVAEPENTQPQPLKAFLHLSDIAKTVALEVTHDTPFDDTLDLVETIIPKLVAFGAGFAEIQDTPDLSRKVDQTIEKSRKSVEDLRKISTELRSAKESIKRNSLVVIDLKDNLENYNTENMNIEDLYEKYGAVLNEGEKLGNIVATLNGFKPRAFEIPPARTTTTTTTTTTTPPTTATTTTPPSTTTTATKSTEPVA